jgi:uncharacterized protein (DUF2235 family)
MGPRVTSTRSISERRPSQTSALMTKTYYDAGIGTTDGEKPSVLRRAWNGFCQATGAGLTGNIIDCYTEILSRYREGDHLFLFGFSRGAYTVRCVATVIRLCGVRRGENSRFRVEGLILPNLSSL